MNSKDTAQISTSELLANSAESETSSHSDSSFPPISNKTLYLLHRGGKVDEMVEELLRDEKPK